MIYSLMYLPPLFAFITLILPIIPMGGVYSLMTGKDCVVSFDFVGGVNYIFIFIGALIIPRACKFVLERII